MFFEKLYPEFKNIVADSSEPCMVTGLIAGTGKSYLCNEYYKTFEDGEAVIIVQNNTREKTILSEHPTFRVETLYKRLNIEYTNQKFKRVRQASSLLLNL